MQPNKLRILPPWMEHFGSICFLTLRELELAVIFCTPEREGLAFLSP